MQPEIYNYMLIYIYANNAKRNLFACLSGMAGHALYGMAPCFGHTGVPFDVESGIPGPGASEVILKPTEAFFFESEGFVLRL